MGDNVPVLRFPEFSGEWEFQRLDHIATINRGRFSPRPRNDPRFYGGDIPFVQTSDVINAGGFIKNHTQTLNKEGLKVSKLFPRGTVLITIAANIGYSGVLEIDMACPDSLVGINCKNDVHNYFINYYFSTQQKYIDYLAPEAAQKNINVNFLASYKISMTSSQEQQKIANFLTSIDTRIQQLTRKKALLEQYKKGMMQKLFSQEIRFKDDQGKDYPDWEEKRLGDILNYEQPTKYLVDDSEYDDSYDIPVLTAGKTFLLGFTNEKHGIFQEKLPTIIFDDFTTAFQYVDFPFKAKSSAMKMLVPKNEKVNVRYVYEAMKRIVFPLGEHKRYWISEYQKEKIPYPSDDEIAKIALFLASVDQKTDVVTHELEKMQRFKQGLLQQMFV